MDQEVTRFRRAAARENRRRRHRAWRYSAALQQQAVAYWTVRARAGDALQDVAMAMGLARQTLHRWTHAARFHRVDVAAEPSGPPSHVVVVITAAGIRVEGLDLEGAAQLVARLR